MCVERVWQLTEANGRSSSHACTAAGGDAVTELELELELELVSV